MVAQKAAIFFRDKELGVPLHTSARCAPFQHAGSRPAWLRFAPAVPATFGPTPAAHAAFCQSMGLSGFSRIQDLISGHNILPERFRDFKPFKQFHNNRNVAVADLLPEFVH